MSYKEDKKFQIQTKYNRYFSEELKKAKVSDLEKGLVSMKELEKQLSISRSTIYKWLYLYGTPDKGVKTVIQMESEQVKTKMLYEKVAELERIIGQKQLQVDYLEKVIELAVQEVGFDIKKKYGPPRWSGSGTTAIDMRMP